MQKNNTLRNVRVAIGAIASLALCIETGAAPARLASGDIINLGSLGPAASEGNGVNALGQVSGVTDTEPSVGGHAFRYDPAPDGSGVMYDLGTLGGLSSKGHGINTSGQVAGAAYKVANGMFHAFRYDGTPGIDGVMLDLGTLGGTDSMGRGINAIGQICGDSSTGSQFHAFRYDGIPGNGGVMRDLGTLAGGNRSLASGVNDSGQVAGNANDALGQGHAFRYDGTPGIDGVMHDLGFGSGQGINDSGFVVGQHFRTAALWRPDLSVVDLNDWRDSVNPADGANWILQQANSVTDTGLITGYGDFDDGPGGLPDGTRAFLLDASSLVPEPGTFLLLGITPLLWSILERVRSSKNLRQPAGRCRRQ